MMRGFARHSAFFIDEPGERLFILLEIESMLVWFLDNAEWLGCGPLVQGFAEPWSKITLRAAAAALVSFLLAVVFGPRWIAWLKRHFREPIKCDSPEICQLTLSKNNTPTMGGLFIVAAWAVAAVLFGNWKVGFVPLAVFLAAGLTAVGALDDAKKIFCAANGLNARKKLLGQLVAVTATAAALYLRQANSPEGLTLHIPVADYDFACGWAYIPWATLVIVGAANAVNLTDGLDGLAGGCSLFAAAAMTGLVYAAGHAEWAEYLHVPKIAGAGELTVLGGALTGAILGFLWFNCHPAQVFMGDTGSLPLGGLLGFMAVVARQEFLLVLVGGVFVVEALSVIIQVSYFKWRRRRIFLCAPLHHHFQLRGWAENKIVVRFWIAGALCALLGAAALKMQVHEKTMKIAVPRAAVHMAAGNNQELLK